MQASRTRNVRGQHPHLQQRRSADRLRLRLRPRREPNLLPRLSHSGLNGIDQTTSITPLGQSAVPLTYAGMGQSERTSSGSTTTKNGLLGKQTETSGGQSTSYVRDPYGTLISKDGPGADDFYYYFDGLGSVIGLIDPQGNQRATYSYDPFGAHANATGVNGSLPSNPWRWGGGYLDTTGLYHFGERYYDPSLGRFLQVDPMEGGSANAYDYCSGNPVDCADPAGTHSYSYSYDLGTRGSAADLAAFTVANCSSVFGIGGCRDNFEEGDRLDLFEEFGPYTQGFPVEVTKITSSSFQFVALKGHPEGAGRLITFNLSAERTKPTKGLHIPKWESHHARTRVKKYQFRHGKVCMGEHCRQYST